MASDPRGVTAECLLAEYLEQISMVNTTEERYLALRALRDGQTPSTWMVFPTKLDDDGIMTDVPDAPEFTAAFRKYVQLYYTAPARVSTADALNRAFVETERAALATRLKPFMGQRLNLGLRVWVWWFTAMPAIEDWCKAYVQGHDNGWLVKRAMLYVMPSGRAWLRGVLASEKRAMPLRFEEAVFATSMAKVDLAAFDARVIQEAPRAEGATVAARGWALVMAAMEVWKRESERLHVTQQLRWSLPFVGKWPSDRMLYAPMWLSALDRRAKTALRCAAIARLCVALSFASMVPAWMISVTNEEHNRLIEVWMKKKEYA